MERYGYDEYLRRSDGSLEVFFIRMNEMRCKIVGDLINKIVFKCMNGIFDNRFFKIDGMDELIQGMFLSAEDACFAVYGLRSAKCAALTPCVLDAVGASFADIPMLDPRDIRIATDTEARIDEVGQLSNE